MVKNCNIKNLNKYLLTNNKTYITFPIDTDTIQEIKLYKMISKSQISSGTWIGSYLDALSQNADFKLIINVKNKTITGQYFFKSVSWNGAEQNGTVEGKINDDSVHLYLIWMPNDNEKSTFINDTILLSGTCISVINNDTTLIQPGHVTEKDRKDLYYYCFFGNGSDTKKMSNPYLISPYHTKGIFMIWKVQD